MHHDNIINIREWREGKREKGGVCNPVLSNLVSVGVKERFQINDIRVRHQPNNLQLTILLRPDHKREMRENEIRVRDD